MCVLILLTPDEVTVTELLVSPKTSRLINLMLDFTVEHSSNGETEMLVLMSNFLNWQVPHMSLDSQQAN